MAGVNKKILILRLSSIGDIVLTSHFVRNVRIKFPDAQIFFVTKVKFSNMVIHNPHIDKVYTFDDSKGLPEIFRLRRLLKTNEYTYIFDLHNNMRTKILKTGLSAKKKYKIRKDKIKRALLVYFKINRYRSLKSIPERYLEVGKEAGIKDDHKGLEIYWKDYVEKRINPVAYEYRITGSDLVIAPGAGFFTKQWPLDYLEELLHLLKNTRLSKIIIVGDVNDAEALKHIRINKKIVNMAGKLDLLEVAVMISRSKVVLSNDSGIMHITSALRKPLIAIFGSTVKELGFFPFRCEHILLENNNIGCRPCSHVGRNTCPQDHFKCMRDITPEQVIEAIKKYIDL